MSKNLLIFRVLPKIV